MSFMTFDKALQPVRFSYVYMTSSKLYKTKQILCLIYTLHFCLLLYYFTLSETKKLTSAAYQIKNQERESVKNFFSCKGNTENVKTTPYATKKTRMVSMESSNRSGKYQK